MERWTRVLDDANHAVWDLEKIMHHAALRAGESSLIRGGGETGKAQRVGGWILRDVGAGDSIADGDGGTRE